MASLRYAILDLRDSWKARRANTPITSQHDGSFLNRYRAPELLTGDANYGKMIDVWAIGCM